MICQHCGEEWNHASEDCPAHPGHLIDAIYDIVRDRKMFEGVLDFEDEDN